MKTFCLAFQKCMGLKDFKLFSAVCAVTTWPAQFASYAYAWKQVRERSGERGKETRGSREKECGGEEGREGGERGRDKDVSVKQLNTFCFVLHHTHITELIRLDDSGTGDVFHLC